MVVVVVVVVGGEKGSGLTESRKTCIHNSFALLQALPAHRTSILFVPFSQGHWSALNGHVYYLLMEQRKWGSSVVAAMKSAVLF